MSNVVGTPDWQRGVVSAGKLLKVVPANIQSTTVPIPPNAAALFVAMAERLAPNTVAIIGVQTGFLYPLTELPGATPYPYDTFIAAPVLSALDQEVTIVFGVAPTSPWYVVSESTAELVLTGVLDLLISETGQTTNPIGIMALGSDGTYSVALATDASGKLVSLVGFDGSYPRALVTDVSGKLIPLVPTETQSTATTGSDALMIAAPASGAWHLFGFSVGPIGAGASGPCELSSGLSGRLNASYFNASYPFSVNLYGFRTTYAVSVNAPNNNLAVLTYAPGP